jgi:hypothetical protein
VHIEYMNNSNNNFGGVILECAKTAAYRLGRGK